MRRAALVLLGGAVLAAVFVVPQGPGRGPEGARIAAEAPPHAAPPLAAVAELVAARARLEAARAGGDDAGSGAGFVPALRDLERALAALRGGIAAAGGEARVAERSLRGEDAANKRLLAALVAAGRARAPDALLPVHPAGPTAAARAAALLAPAEADLERHAAALGGRLQALAALGERRAEAEALLGAGLVALAEAEDALRLAAAVEPAPPGPPDPRTALAALARDSDTLSDLASGLAGPVPAEVAALAEAAEAARAAADVAAEAAIGEASEAGVVVAAVGDLAATDAAAAEAGSDGAVSAEGAAGDPARITRSSRNLGAGEGPFFDMPVSGRVLRGFRERDAAGETRPGLTLAAAPRGVVTAPAAGEVRYVGPFLDFDTVIAIAPADGTIVLLAGLAEAVVAPGALVPAGAVLGFLGGRALDAQEFLMLSTQGTAAHGAETLYMELWRGGEPVDPSPWLGLDPGSRNG